MARCGSLERRRRCCIGSLLVLSLLLLGAAVSLAEESHKIKASSGENDTGADSTWPDLHESGNDEMLWGEKAGGGAEPELEGGFVESVAKGRAAGSQRKSTSTTTTTTLSPAAQKIHAQMAARAGSTDVRSKEQMYEEVLQELENDPRFKRAKATNDALAEGRARRISKWLKENPDKAKATKSHVGDHINPDTRKNYDQVVKELKTRFEKQGQSSPSSSDVKAAPTKRHNFQAEQGPTAA